MLTVVTKLTLKAQYAYPNYSEELNTLCSQIAASLMREDGCEGVWIGRGQDEDDEKRREMFWITSEYSSSQI